MVIDLLVRQNKMFERINLGCVEVFFLGFFASYRQINLFNPEFINRDINWLIFFGTASLIYVSNSLFFFRPHIIADRSFKLVWLVTPFLFFK